MRTKVIYYLLVFCFLFLQVDYSLAASSNVEISSKSHSELPVKPRKERKKLKKTKGADKTNSNSVLINTLSFLAPIIAVLLLWIGIPFSIFSLLIVGISIIGVSLMVFIISLKIMRVKDEYLIEKSDALFGNIVFGIIFLLIEAFYFFSGLGFLIWGLVVSQPLFWIAGIFTLSFILFSTLAMLFLD